MIEDLFLDNESALEILKQMHENEVEVFEKARKEYAQSPNIFANFTRGGERLDIEPEKVLLVFAMKHFDGIIAHVNGFQEQREKIEGRITDLRIYLSLLQMMIETKRKADGNN